MKTEDIKMFKAWMVDIHYAEDTECGFGHMTTITWIRDDGKDNRLRRIYDSMERDDAKSILCDMIDVNCEPCDDYEDDMEWSMYYDPTGCHGEPCVVLTSKFRV